MHLFEVNILKCLFDHNLQQNVSVLFHLLQLDYLHQTKMWSIYKIVLRFQPIPFNQLISLSIFSFSITHFLAKIDLEKLISFDYCAIYRKKNFFHIFWVRSKSIYIATKKFLFTPVSWHRNLKMLHCYVSIVKVVSFYHVYKNIMEKL